MIKISKNGVSVPNAKNSELVFTDEYPFHKLDKLNDVSFQNIRIYFNSDTPNPSGVGPDVGPVSTLIYSFPHGYKYVPATWFMTQVNNQYVYEEGAQIASAFANSFVLIRMEVDATNVNIYVDKYYISGFGTPTDISAMTLLIRVYVFAEDLQI